MPRHQIPAAPDIGQRIRSMREQRNVSREDLAAQIRADAGTTTSTNTLGRWESDGKLAASELRIIATILEVPASYLLLGGIRPKPLPNDASGESGASDPGPARDGAQPDRRPSEPTRKSLRASRRAQDE